MFNSILKISEKKFEGTLDMEVLKKTQYELLELGLDITIQEIFKGLSENKYDFICALAIQSIVKSMKIDANEIVDIFIKEKDLKVREANLINLNLFINDLLKKCMPKTKQQDEDSEFVDFPTFKSKDWDLAYMEFVWNTTMNKTNNFWDITPKNYFEQIEVFKEVNNIKEEKVEWN